MKKDKNKMMDPQETKAAPTALVCIRECVMPNVAIWKPGDKVTDPDLLQLLKGNENFEELKEDK